jgi:hypothetical protein
VGRFVHLLGFLYGDPVVLAVPALSTGFFLIAAGVVDGQIADKTVLLVLAPTSLYLYVRGCQAAALAVAGDLGFY